MSGAIFTSNLPNDRDMIRELGKLAVPVPLFTDCCFAGAGDGGASLLVCVERKKIGDLAACINDGRFLFQAQGCKEAGCDVLVLITEGECRPGPEDGLLEIPVWGVNPRTNRRAEMWVPVKPTTVYSRYDQYLTELNYLVGVIVKRSRDVRETAAVIKALWDNFQTPPSGHVSLHQIFTAPLGRVELVRPGLVRRVAKELDGIGWQRSRAVAEHFGSVFEVASADAREWLKVPGIGRKLAERLVRDIRGPVRPRRVIQAKPRVSLGKEDAELLGVD